MQTERNLDYYQSQFDTLISPSYSDSIQSLVLEMMNYGKTIPSTSGRDKKARPLPESDGFKSRLLNLKSEINNVLYAVMYEFLMYIVWHELISGWRQPE